jgi:hypothetical protein
MPSYDRREIFPSHLRRAGQTLTSASRDRREVFTELEIFCRCYHDAASISRHRSRSGLTVPQHSRQEPISTDPAMSADGHPDEFSADAPPEL